MVLSRGGYFISTSMMDKFLWQIMRFLSRLVNFFLFKNRLRLSVRRTLVVKALYLNNLATKVKDNWLKVRHNWDYRLHRFLYHFMARCFSCVFTIFISKRHLIFGILFWSKNNYRLVCILINPPPDHIFLALPLGLAIHPARTTWYKLHILSSLLLIIILGVGHHRASVFDN